MFNIYFVSQLLVIISYTFCGIAFLQKKQIKILILVSVFNLFMLTQYTLLNATMGIIANLINIIRNILFIINLKNNKNNSWLLLILFSCSMIILTIIFYKSYLDIFPCIIALIGTFSYWINNTKILRLSNILCSVCYIVYAVPIHSYVTMIAETCLIVTTILGYLKHETNQKIQHS